MTTGKTIALTRWTCVGKVMSLLFNMLSRLVITFLLRSKHLLNSWLQSPSPVILEYKKIKSATVSTVSPSICHEVMGPDAMILVFWMLNFKPTFSLSFTFVKRLFSSSSLFAIRVVSSAYLMLLIFLPGILIPACASSGPAFLMMYSAYKLNKQGDNTQVHSYSEIQLGLCWQWGTFLDLYLNSTHWKSLLPVPHGFWISCSTILFPFHYSLKVIKIYTWKFFCHWLLSSFINLLHNHEDLRSFWNWSGSHGAPEYKSFPCLSVLICRK